MTKYVFKLIYPYTTSLSLPGSQLVQAENLKYAIRTFCHAYGLTFAHTDGESMQFHMRDGGIVEYTVKGGDME